MKKKTTTVKKTLDGEKKTKTDDEIEMLLRNKVSYYKDVIRKTMLSVQKYKKMEIIGASELNVCLNGLETLYNQLILYDNNLQSVKNIDECISNLQIISNEISTLIKTFGTDSIDDLINICFGVDFIKGIVNENNIDKYNVIKKYVHPISYIISMGKGTTSNKKTLCKTRLVEDNTIADLAESFDCFDLARVSGVFQIKVYGVKIAIQNKKLGKTLIISAVVDDLLLNCIDMPFIKNRLHDIKENKPTEQDFQTKSYDKYIDSITIKDLIVYNNDELNNKFAGYLTQAYLIKQKSINQVITEFINTDLFTKRLTLIQLLLKSSEYEFQYIAYLLYDLLSNDENNNNDSYEQTLLFDSFSWNIKKFFRDAMRQTIKYTDQLSNFDNNKIPLEQQICLMKVSEQVKEKAMVKLKEVKAKSEDSGSKARQYLEGLLKIPFGVYREEEVLTIMKTMIINFTSIIENIKPFIENNELVIKDKYTNIEVIKYKDQIKDKYFKIIVSNVLNNIKTYFNVSNRRDVLTNVEILNALLKKYNKKNLKITHSGRNIKDINTSINNILDELSNDLNILDELFTKINVNVPLTLSTLENDLTNLDKKWDDTVNYMNVVNETLDTAVHGHKKAKQQVERIIGQWMNGENSGYCFGFEGPPGVGKTSLAKKGIANCLKNNSGESRPFSFIALGGSTNSSTLDGHNYTYVGSTWGRIVDILIEKKCMNPIIFIDELDKVSRTEHGKEIIGILTHLVDPTQNDAFQDKYFNGIDLDLSKVLFIFSYNDVELIDRILLDRIHRVKFKHLSLKDKQVITRDFIMPEILSKMGLCDMINIDDDVVEFIVEEYTCESGVRKLKELIFEIVGEINLNVLKKTVEYEIPINITIERVKELLKDRQKVHKKKIHASPSVGIINGLWANALGQGGIIQIEAKYFVSGTLFDLKLTGMQGDVMKESMSVAKTLALELTPPERVEKLVKRFDETKMQGVHIHCPEGAVPKDGPSAGTAITTVLYSLLNDKKIKHDVAITGEMCLQGKVTAIGGLDLKIIGGIKAGVKTFLYPKENTKEFDEFMELYKESDLVKGISFHEIETIQEVFDLVFEN